MIASPRYLQASLFSFCIHASIFLYLYGTFDRDSAKSLLISKPLQIELKFASDVEPSLQSAIKNTTNLVKASISEPEPSVKLAQKIAVPELKSTLDFLMSSNLNQLLSEESAIELTEEQEIINAYAHQVIKTIESAWIKPQNIPDGLIANLRLSIKLGGRITQVDLQKSSGNLRFDNSALQAVRRVDSFFFFSSMPADIYQKEFKSLSISFNPS